MDFVFPLLSFKKHGGVRVLSVLMNHLSEAGHNVILMVPRNRFEGFYELSEKVSVKYLKNSSKNPISIFKTLIYFYKHSPKSSYIVVSFFPTFYAALLCKIFKKSRIIYYRQDAEQYFYPFPFSLIAHLSYILPHELRPAVSTWVMKRTHSTGPLIHPPVSHKFLNSGFEDTVKENEIVVFFRYKKNKGPATALKILKHPALTNFKIHVVGDNPHLNLPNISFHGYLKELNLIKVLNRSKFFILTSKFEGFGLPPLEAMARGAIPIVFTNTGPADYIIHGVNGFITLDMEEAINIIKDLTNDQEKWLKIAKNAIETAKRFTEENFFQKFLEMLSKDFEKTEFSL